MAYEITYPSQKEVSVALTANSAKDAVTLARALVEKGHAPTISDKDGQKFTLEELDRIVAGGSEGVGG